MININILLKTENKITKKRSRTWFLQKDKLHIYLEIKKDFHNIPKTLSINVGYTITPR